MLGFFLPDQPLGRILWGKKPQALQFPLLPHSRISFEEIAMPFKATWDAAKKKFETESGQKKERAPIFFGLFNVGGSGLGSALDKVEKAKTKKDFDAAWKSYMATAKKYGETINKAIDNLTKTEFADDAPQEAKANAVKVKKAYGNLWAVLHDIESDAQEKGKKLK
jgi:hypothetical protein